MSLKYDRAFGIDLGTTNSEAAALDPFDREVEVLRDRFGRATHASAVAAGKDGFVTGRAARRKRGSASPPLESMKRRMGEKIMLPVGEAQVSPEEASSYVLRDLKDGLEAQLRERIGATLEGAALELSRAVITVPAYFDAPQIDATIRAGELAGLEVLGVLHEPTAAAMYHRFRGGLVFEKGSGHVLVYDLGGGTFDVSVLRCIGNEYQVLAIAGDNYLGGDDFDRRYAEVLRRQLASQGYAVDFDASDERFGVLVEAARSIKEKFSAGEVVVHSARDAFRDLEGEPVDFDFEVDQATYIAEVADLIDTTFECVGRAMHDARESGMGGTLDYVVLVGGSTRLPAIATRVRNELCADGAKLLQEEVDSCVAMGAAIHAAGKGGQRFVRGPWAVHLQSPVSTSSPTLALRVAALRDGSALAVPLEACRDGETLGELEATPGVLRIPIEEGEALLELRLPETSFPLPVFRGAVGARPSALSQAAVLAKDLAVEVVRGGRLGREVILSRGAALPSKASHRFATGDESGAVVLRLLQDRLPIHTLAFEVADLPIGSPVDLELSVDESMRIEVNARVGGQSLWVQVQRAEGGELGERVRARLAEGDALAERLWGQEGRAFRRAYEQLAAAIGETLAHDPGRAAHLVRRLEQLLDNFREEGTELSPPLFRFEAAVDMVRRDVLAGGASALGLDADGWHGRIAELLARGRSAWDQKDADAWRRAYDEAQALRETVSEERFAAKGALREEHWLERFRRLLTAAAHLEEELAAFVLALEPAELRARQSAERERLREAALALVAQPASAEQSLQELRERVHAGEAEVGRISAALARLPHLGRVTRG